MTDIDSGRGLAGRVLASRRGLLCGAAALGAAGALAACGAAPPRSSGPGGASGGASQALAGTDEVPVGGGIVVGETVIVQPTADEFLAFSAVCPHQGSLLRAPDESGAIVCPSHGSQFDMEGALVQGPAETGLTEVGIAVEDGQIFLA